MLWPLVLPAQITFCLFALVVALATLAAPSAKCNRRPVSFFSTTLAILMFVPSCMGIMNVLDKHRFGEFEIATFDDVNDFRVERYLPSAARDITIEKFALGFRARFSITQEELDSFIYIDGTWTDTGRSVLRNREPLLHSQYREYLQSIFEGLDWDLPESVIEYEGPRAGNGAGFTIWYDPETETAYEDAGYW